MTECVFCNYRIKDCKTTPRKQLTRKDLASFEFFGKWICGDDHDSLYEFLEGESSPDSTFTDEPKTMGRLKVNQMDSEDRETLPATEKQKSYIRELLKNLEGAMFSYIFAELDSLTMGQASRVIEVLKNAISPNNHAAEKPNQELPITDKQKAYIKEIYSENDWNWDEEEISNMTRKEASELISGCIGGGAE